MLSELFTQLLEFSCHPEVTTQYSIIRNLRRSKLKESLRIRGLSSMGDESTLRVRLLRYEMQFYHPEIYMPYPTENNRLSNVEAATWRLSLETLCDMVRAFCADAEANAFTNAIDRDKQSTLRIKKPEAVTARTNVLNASTEDWLSCARLLNDQGLKYNGARGVPARRFLENLEDFRKFSKISDRMLLQTLPCALDSNTKKWYRTNNFTDWQTFEKKFVKNFVLMTKSYAAVTASNSTSESDDRLSQNSTPVRLVDSPKHTDEMSDRAPMSIILREALDSPINISSKTIDSMLTDNKKSIFRNQSNSKSFVIVPPSKTASIINPSKTKETVPASTGALKLEARSSNSDKYQTSLSTAENEFLKAKNAIEAYTAGKTRAKAQSSAINLHHNLVIAANKSLQAAHPVAMANPNFYNSLQMLNQEHMSKVQRLVSYQSNVTANLNNSITYATSTLANAYGSYNVQAFHNTLHNLTQEYLSKVQMLPLTQPHSVVVKPPPGFSQMSSLVNYSPLMNNNLPPSKSRDNADYE